MTTTSTPLLSTKSTNLFFPPPPTAWERFKWNPVFFLAQYFYALAWSGIKPARASTRYPPITIVCISDTHKSTPSGVPDGDVLLHAGDMTNWGTFEELQAQINWLNTLPHPHKIAIAGNHDLLLDEKFVARSPSFPALRPAAELDWGSVTYLCNSSTTLSINGRNIKIFGSPQTPQYGNWAFQYPLIRDVWRNTVPEDTDVLLTHGPPKGHLDLARKGCKFLNMELWRVRPRLVVFGHIHEGRGQEDVCWSYVHGIYDAVVREESGWLGLLGMAVVVGWGFLTRRKEVGRTTLVNAAMVWEGKKEKWEDKVVMI